MLCTSDAHLNLNVSPAENVHIASQHFSPVSSVLQIIIIPVSTWVSFMYDYEYDQCLHLLSLKLKSNFPWLSQCQYHRLTTSTTTISNLILNAQSAVFITHCLGEQCHEHVLIMHKMLMTLVCKNCITWICNCIIVNWCICSFSKIHVFLSCFGIFNSVIIDLDIYNGFDLISLDSFSKESCKTQNQTTNKQMKIVSPSCILCLMNY